LSLARQLVLFCPHLQLEPGNQTRFTLLVRLPGLSLKIKDRKNARGNTRVTANIKRKAAPKGGPGRSWIVGFLSSTQSTLQSARRIERPISSSATCQPSRPDADINEPLSDRVKHVVHCTPPPCQEIRDIVVEVRGLRSSKLLALDRPRESADALAAPLG
jgi:hypothetical protein